MFGGKYLYLVPKQHDRLEANNLLRNKSFWCLPLPFFLHIPIFVSAFAIPYSVQDKMQPK